MYSRAVRTTVEFDADTAKAIARLRRERGLGVSEAVNELIRLGLLHRPSQSPFRQATRPMGAKIDISNVAEALDAIEDGAGR